MRIRGGKKCKWQVSLKSSHTQTGTGMNMHYTVNNIKVSSSSSISHPSKMTKYMVETQRQGQYNI